jgi:hypothetical protein
MGFGRNPYVAKAQAAEQKAADAPDKIARTRAYRDAAHQWDRAAERENPGKHRDEYERNAARNRDLADGAEPADATAPDADADEQPGSPLDLKRLN